MTAPSTLRTTLLTVTALVAFAANSVLCRLALESGRIDAASFTAVRLLSGVAALLVIATVRRGAPRRSTRDWPAAGMLFLYAASFSYAYVSLPAGTGALILFGAVQATMILVALVRGERPGALEWTGLFTALGGLFYLVAPGLTAPPLGGSALMAVAGIAWGVYSVRGGRSGDPIGRTRDNFVRAAPLSLFLIAGSWGGLDASAVGVLLAVISGAVTSGAGYAIWYSALKGLDATRAAIVQLAVPVLAAAAGVFFLGERLSWRLTLAALLILGGVALALAGGRWRRVSAARRWNVR